MTGLSSGGIVKRLARLLPSESYSGTASRVASVSSSSVLVKVVEDRSVVSTST